MVKKKSAKKGRSPARSKTAKTGRRKRAAGRAAGAKHRRRPAKGVRARRPKQAPPIHLTPREEEVFRLFSLGCTVKEAAAILELSPSTVDNHKTRLMAKLGTDKTALLTRLALKMGATTMRDKLTAAEKRRSGRKRDGWN